MLHPSQTIALLCLGPSQAHSSVSIAPTAAHQAVQRSSVLNSCPRTEVRTTVSQRSYSFTAYVHVHVRVRTVVCRHVRGAALRSLGNFEEARGAGEVLTLGAGVHLPLGCVRVDDFQTLAKTTTTITSFVGTVP